MFAKAIVRMGVPVAARNIFPSNIQGLPTWYEIRVTGDGYQARSDHVDLMIAMNAQTYARDLAEVAPGGWLIYDSTWPRSKRASQRPALRAGRTTTMVLCSFSTISNW